MEVITGKPISSEIVVGKLHFCLRSPQLLSAFSSLSPEAEMKRFRSAQIRAIEQLQEAYECAYSLVGEHNASIFKIYSMMVEDGEYQEKVHEFINSHDLTAEYAVLLAGEKYASIFAAMEDEYMSARAADIRNVANHMISVLMNNQVPDTLGPEPVILVGDEFSPGRVLFLERDKLLGVVARRGSVNSHAAELARALGVPTLVQTGLSPKWDGYMAVLDGENGKLYVNPTDEVVAEAQIRMGRKKETAV